MASQRSTTGGRRIFGRKMDFLGCVKDAAFRQHEYTGAHFDICGRMKLALTPHKQNWSIEFSEVEIRALIWGVAIFHEL